MPPNKRVAACHYCSFRDKCPAAGEGKTCGLIDPRAPKLGTPEDVLSQQRKLLSDSLRDVAKARELASLGFVSYSDVAELRSRTFQLGTQFMKNLQTSGARDSDDGIRELMGLGEESDG